MQSSQLNTPGGGYHQKNYLSGNMQPMGNIPNYEGNQDLHINNVMDY